MGITLYNENKRFYKKYHWDLMEDLQVFWDFKYRDAKMPIDPDTNQEYYRASYFRHLADKYEVVPKTIEAFEVKENPKNPKNQNQKQVSRLKYVSDDELKRRLS